MLLPIVVVVCLIHSIAVHGSPPIVLWHGMGDSCCNPLSLGSIMKLIEQQFTPAPYIHSIRIGSNEAEDTSNGFFMNINKQIDYACHLLNADKNLSQGYHAIG
jgi:palmitoyl-protein thioesterase